jgi:hypothetical protein
MEKISPLDHPSFARGDVVSLLSFDMGAFDADDGRFCH